MKNWPIWVDNFIFILTLGMIAFIDDIHRITGVPVQILVLLTAITIIFSGAKSFSKIIIFLKNVFH